MPTETSVALSLAELTQIEEARLEQERAERRRQQSDRVRREREAETRRRAEEEASARAEAAARDERARQEAIERARNAAREKAAIEVARIQAEAKARLEVENAVRAHELAVLRTRQETGRRRRELVLGAALAVLVAVGGVAAWDASTRRSDYEHSVGELREREHALLREREEQKRVELQSLERRHAALLARPRASAAKQALATASSAHAAIDARSPSQERMRTFADSLDALDSRIDRLDEVALLDQRHTDLSVWAASRRRTGGLDAVKAAALRAKAESSGADAVMGYARALDRLASELGQRSGSVERPVATGTGHDNRTCREGDPGCGLDGKPLF